MPSCEPILSQDKLVWLCPRSLRSMSSVEKTVLSEKLCLSFLHSFSSLCWSKRGEIGSSSMLCVHLGLLSMPTITAAFWIKSTTEHKDLKLCTACLGTLLTHGINLTNKIGIYISDVSWRTFLCIPASKFPWKLLPSGAERRDLPFCTGHSVQTANAPRTKSEICQQSWEKTQLIYAGLEKAIFFPPCDLRNLQRERCSRELVISTKHGSVPSDMQRLLNVWWNTLMPQS